MPAAIAFLDLIEDNSGEELTAVLWSDGVVSKDPYSRHQESWPSLREFLRAFPDLDVKSAGACSQ